MNQNNQKQLTREELYEKVWSIPTTKIAAELGISDVALKKRCDKLNVPKPPLGYWAKVAAGQTPPKMPLPAEPKPVKYESLDAPVASKLSLPDDNQELHPVASELRVTLLAATPDSNKRAKAEDRTIPRVIVSKPLIDRTAKALHVILTTIEARGIPFHKSRSKYEGAYFEKGYDRLNLTLEELLVAREPTTQEKCRPSWEWQQFGEPSGKLTFTVNPAQSTARSEKKWTENDKLPLEEVLSKTVQAICKYYADLERERIAAFERNRKAAEEYEIRQQAEQKRQHLAALEAVAHTRSEDLLKAAEWWRLHRATVEFINECERRWRGNAASELTNEQQAWLAWARENAEAMSPFNNTYPDPATDGAFDPATVSFGGTYPAKRDFPRPPTMPKIPAPVVQQSSYSHAPPKEPYPFWLKYQRR
jgi:hypothetical protein